MGVFSDFVKALHDSAAGRITVYPNMWAKIGSKWDKKRIVNVALAGKRDWCNSDGNMIYVNEGKVLVSRQAVWKCPNPPGDDFVSNQVPITECRKCPYHRKRGQEFNFPRCVFDRSEDKESVANMAVEKINSALTGAVEKAKEILN